MTSLRLHWRRASRLAQQGIRAEVLDIHTLKPLDRDLIVASARKTGRVVTLEDHQINGGLGSAVAEVLGEECPTPMRRIGLRDTFAESGEYRLLLRRVRHGRQPPLWRR